MSTLDDFIAESAQALGLGNDELPDAVRTELLDLTREVAHGVTRIAGPLSTYLLGVGVGRGLDRAAGADAIARIARDWENRPADAAAPEVRGSKGEKE